jgi:hypothetical protein
MCIIAIINTGNQKICEIFNENGTGIVKNIHEAYGHLNAIERLIDGYVEPELLGEESVVARLEQRQVNQLETNAAIDKKSLKMDRASEKKFKELFEIIEKLKN